MVVCALALRLVAIMVALTPPPHDPAKRKPSDDQNPSALVGLPTQLDPLRSVALVHSAAGSERAQEPTPRPTRAQEPDATKANALRIRKIEG
eukprot:SAG31_NODE_60_length_29419_cov_39.876398_3_plen_92_part_00